MSDWQVLKYQLYIVHMLFENQSAVSYRGVLTNITEEHSNGEL